MVSDEREELPQTATPSQGFPVVRTYSPLSPPEGIPILPRTYTPFEILKQAQLAHDINNKLSLIVGYASLLHVSMLKGETRNDAASILAEIEESAQTASELVNRISQQSKGMFKAVTPGSFKLSDFIRDSHRSLSASLSLTGHGAEISADGNAYILATKLDLECILDNLVINARDASPPGERVLVSTRDETIEGFVGEYGPVPAGVYAVLRVKDNGRGIESAHLPQIFKPYFTTKKSGTGIGLTVVKGIVETSRGYIDIETRTDPPSGTEFRIYFPRINPSLHKD